MRHDPAIEPSCPVPLHLLALLLRSDEAMLNAAVDALPETQRSALALYCFSRYHMRRIGFAVALRCSERSLEGLGGATGRQVLERARIAAGIEHDAAKAERKVAPTRAAA
jgi:hypothetical protein